MRWEIEMLFGELKSQLRIEHMPSGNKAAAECLLFASILGLAFDRKLRSELAPRTEVILPAERWSILFRALAPVLLDLLLGAPDHRPYLERRLRRVLLVEGPDPNRYRPSLHDQLQSGSGGRRRSPGRMPKVVGNPSYTLGCIYNGRAKVEHPADRPLQPWAMEAAMGKKRTSP